MMGPLVSCVIPTHFRPDLVCRAVKSALAQTYRHLEVIVVDDSKSDETHLALKQFGSAVKYIRNERAVGAPHSRNLGIDSACGEFVAFLDDDDVWLPEKTEVQLRYARRYPLVGCNSSTRVGRRRFFTQPPRRVSFQNLLTCNHLGSCSFVMCSRAAIAECRFDVTLPCAQDWDMWLQILRNADKVPAYVVGRYLVDYNSGEHGRISTANPVLRGAWAIWGRYSQYFTPSMMASFVARHIPVGGSPIRYALREWATCTDYGGESRSLLLRLIARLIGIRRAS